MDTALATLPLSRHQLQQLIDADELEAARKADRLDIDASKARCQSLYQFMREAWPILEPETPFVGGWAVEAICDHLEAVHRGEIKRLLINVPPGMSKSLTTGVFFPAWEWGPCGEPGKRYLATSFSGPNVNRDTGKLQKLVESEWYQARWGYLVQPSKKWGEKLIRNKRSGQREGRPFGSMTGGRGDRVIIDDPHSTETAESPVERGNTIRIFREQLTDRLNNVAESAIIVIMQRLHEGDVAGTILQLNEKLEMPYVHLNLPMEFERVRKEGGRLVDARCRTYVNGVLFFEDPRTMEGELLFPERFPRNAVEDLKISKGSYAYNGQYQQRPVPREGGLFKREWFEGRILPMLPEWTAVVRAWDLAGTEQKPGNDPDATAGLKMYRCEDGRFVIGHVDRFMESPGKTEANIKFRGELDGADCPIRLPLDPGQAGKYQLAQYIRSLAGFTVYSERPAGSKEARATPLATQAEHGFVWLLDGPWISDFLDELCNFPNARYDDQVDAAATAFNFLAPVSNDSRYASANERATAGLIKEDQEAELMRRAAQSSGGRAVHSVAGRMTGILG